MAEIVEGMMAGIEPAFQAGDASPFVEQHDRVAVLRDLILEYLQEVARSELTDEEADEHARLVAATVEIESLSGVIAMDLAPLTESIPASGITPSEQTVELLTGVLDATIQVTGLALRSLVESDERAAQQVLAFRTEVDRLGGEMLRQQAARLAEDDPDRLQKHRVQVDLLDKLRRVFSLAEHMAVSVLPRGALAGHLGG